MEYETVKIRYHKEYRANSCISDVISLNGHQK